MLALLVLLLAQAQAIYVAAAPNSQIRARAAGGSRGMKAFGYDAAQQWRRRSDCNAGAVRSSTRSLELETPAMGLNRALEAWVLPAGALEPPPRRSEAACFQLAPWANSVQLQPRSAALRPKQHTRDCRGEAGSNAISTGSPWATDLLTSQASSACNKCSVRGAPRPTRPL